MGAALINRAANINANGQIWQAKSKTYKLAIYIAPFV